MPVQLVFCGGSSRAPTPADSSPLRSPRLPALHQTQPGREGKSSDIPQLCSLVVLCGPGRGDWARERPLAKV